MVSGTAATAQADSGATSDVTESTLTQSDSQATVDGEGTAGAEGQTVAETDVVNEQCSGILRACCFGDQDVCDCGGSCSASKVQGEGDVTVYRLDTAPSFGGLVAGSTCFC